MDIPAFTTSSLQNALRLPKTSLTRRRRLYLAASRVISRRNNRRHSKHTWPTVTGMVRALSGSPAADSFCIPDASAASAASSGGWVRIIPLSPRQTGQSGTLWSPGGEDTIKMKDLRTYTQSASYLSFVKKAHTHLVSRVGICSRALSLPAIRYARRSQAPHLYSHMSGNCRGDMAREATVRRIFIHDERSKKCIIPTG